MMDAKRRKILILQVGNIIAYFVMIITNAMANILPINNQTTGAVSDKYPNLFAPIGVTFSIWGLIYLLLGLFVLYQLGLFTRLSRSHEAAVLRTGWLFVLSSFANALWIFLWHYDLILASFAVMVILLACLALLVRNSERETTGNTGFWLYRLAFSVYLGWISVATIANATALLVFLEWNGFGLSEWFWTLLVMVAGTVLAFLYLLLNKDVAYALVVVWAFAGILWKHVAVFELEYFQIVIGASVLSCLILAGIARTLIGKQCVLRKKTRS